MVAAGAGVRCVGATGVVEPDGFDAGGAAGALRSGALPCWGAGLSAPAAPAVAPTAAAEDAGGVPLADGTAGGSSALVGAGSAGGGFCVVLAGVAGTGGLSDACADGASDPADGGGALYDGAAALPDSGGRAVGSASRDANTSAPAIPAATTGALAAGDAGGGVLAGTGDGAGSAFGGAGATLIGGSAFCGGGSTLGASGGGGGRTACFGIHRGAISVVRRAATTSAPSKGR